MEDLASLSGTAAVSIRESILYDEISRDNRGVRQSMR
jgi:hypothetical protein